MLVHEAVIERFAPGQPPGDATFGQDRGLVSVDGAERNAETFGNLFRAESKREGAEYVAASCAESLPDLPAARFVDCDQSSSPPLNCCRVGEGAQSGEIGAPRRDRESEQSETIDRIEVHVSAAFDPLERRFRGVHMPDLVVVVAEEGGD